MTPAQMQAARVKIRKHYQLDRKVTDAEVIAEVKNLRRKHGDYDDFSGMLAAALQTGAHPIEIRQVGTDANRGDYMAAKQKRILVKNIKHLKKILAPVGNEISPKDFFILLGGAVRSSKYILYDKDRAPGESLWWVQHQIDGSEEEFNSDKAFLSETHIGEAIKKKAFYWYGW